MSIAPGTRNKASMSFRDAGNEIGRFSVTGPDVVTENLDDVEALFVTFTNTVNAITLGAITKVSYVNEASQATTQPTNGAAREFKLLVQYQVTSGDNIGARWQVSIPTLDPSKVHYVININAKDVVDMGAGIGTEMAAFVAAFNAFVVDPANGTGTVAVVGLKVVGRNN